jgi:hypothetical protein
MSENREERFLLQDDEVEFVRKTDHGLHLTVEVIRAARARVAAGEDPDVVASELATEEVAIQAMLDNPEMIGEEDE